MECVKVALPRHRFLSRLMRRNPVLGLFRICCLEKPPVNWPKAICCGAHAIRVEISVTCGSPVGVTVASKPIFIAGWVLWISSGEKAVRDQLIFDSYSGSIRRV